MERIKDTRCRKCGRNVMAVRQPREQVGFNHKGQTVMVHEGEEAGRQVVQLSAPRFSTLRKNLEAACDGPSN